jgi:acetoin utilization deacetylase AcuC-like enzyme
MRFNVKIIHSLDHRIHAPKSEIINGQIRPYLEPPSRAELILARLDQNPGVNRHEFLAPREFGLKPVLELHQAGYIAYLERAYREWADAGCNPDGVLPFAFAVKGFRRRSINPFAEAGQYAFDLSAPIVAGTYRAARESANSAMTGAMLLREGVAKTAYALCRPPGHHATSRLSGRHCYINNAACAAQKLTRVGRVVVLDLDAHHGNGTQELFYDRHDVFTVSIHADPDRSYPYFSGFADETGEGIGTGFNLNYPLRAEVDTPYYLGVLENALETIDDFRPDFLVVALGVNTFIHDPTTDFCLSQEAYPQIGGRLKQLNLPTLFVQEGGAALPELGENVHAVLEAFEV